MTKGVITRFIDISANFYFLHLLYTKTFSELSWEKQVTQLSITKIIQFVYNL